MSWVRLALAAAIVLPPSAADPQSSPGFRPGQQLTAASLNAALSAKVDYPFNPSLFPLLNVKSFGALGNTTSATDGNITSGQSVLTSVSRPCNGDSGKYIVIHGSGAASAAQFGTVTSCGGGGAFNLSFAASTTTNPGSGISGYFTVGSDDTAAVTNAVIAATAVGACAYFPNGSYWLASQSSAITLAKGCLMGDPTTNYGWPYTGYGSVLLISNTSTQAFSLGNGFTISGMTFYYPLQDSAGASPTVYPPLFESATISKGLVEKSTFVDPYILMKTDTGGIGFGDVRFSNNRMYCIFYCWQFANGASDVLQVDNSFISVGVYQDIANGANLGNWTQSNGEMIHADIGGAAHTSLDGMMFSNNIIHGYHMGVRMVTGLLNVSAFSNNVWDDTPTILSVEGTTGAVAFTSFTGGNCYCQDLVTASAAENVFNFTSTNAGTSYLTISGLEIAYAMGNIISDASGALTTLKVSGGGWQNWGQSTTTGTYYGFVSSSQNTNARITINGVVAEISNAVGSNSYVGVSLDGGVNSITGNAFYSNNTAVQVAGSSSAFHRIGNNVSANTTGTSSFSDSSSGSVNVITSGNLWDKRKAPSVASGSSDCGTSPSFNGQSDDWHGVLTVGTSANGSQCTVTFNSKIAGSSPVCFVYDATSASLVRSAVSSASVVVFAGAFGAGDLLLYSCTR